MCQAAGRELGGPLYTAILWGGGRGVLGIVPFYEHTVLLHAWMFVRHTYALSCLDHVTDAHGPYVHGRCADPGHGHVQHARGPCHV